MNTDIELKHGDLVGVEGKIPTVWAIKYWVKPGTRYYHWLKIDGWARPGEDVRILESISKRFFGASGLRPGLLSHYEGKRVVIYRHRLSDNYISDAKDGIHPMPMGMWSCLQLVREHAHAQYDYPLIVRLFVEGLIKSVLYRRRLTAEDFHYTKDHLVICTEAAAVGYDVDPVVPQGVLPIPNSIVAAEKRGVIAKVFEGVL